MGYLTNLLTIPVKWIKPLVSLTWGCSAYGDKPDFTSAHVSLGKERTTSLYYNGIFFIRLMLPFYIGAMIRWSGSETKKAFIQTHIGWKLNGKFAITFRIQSDESGFLSNQGPAFNNHNQARGWACGGK